MACDASVIDAWRKSGRRHRSKLILSLLLLCITAHAAATSCSTEIIKPHRDMISLPHVGDVSLGTPDDSNPPTAWQGPMSAGACSLDLGIIEAPFLASHSGAVFVTTYSGAMRSVALVDLRACIVRWKSRPFVGDVRADAAGLRLGQRYIAFNKLCVPDAKH